MDSELTPEERIEQICQEMCARRVSLGPATPAMIAEMLPRAIVRYLGEEHDKRLERERAATEELTKSLA